MGDFLVRALLFGNVLMGDDMAAVGQPHHLHRHDPAIVELHHAMGGLAGVTLGFVADHALHTRAVPPAERDEILDRETDQRIAVGEIVDLDQAPVGNDDPAVAIEHVETLGHVLDRTVQPVALEADLGAQFLLQRTPRLDQKLEGAGELNREVADLVAAPQQRGIDRTALPAARGMPQPVDIAGQDFEGPGDGILEIPADH